MTPSIERRKTSEVLNVQIASIIHRVRNGRRSRRVKSMVQWDRQAKALTAWRRGSVWDAREIGSGFSKSDVGHREIVGPRGNPRMDSDRSATPRERRLTPSSSQLEACKFAELTATVKEE